MKNLKEHILDNDLLFELYVNFSNHYTINDTLIFESKFSTKFNKPIIYIDKKILKGFERLKPQQLDILRDRLLYKKTLQEIATMHNITRERVRQIEQKSIRVFFATIEASFIMDIIQNVQQKLFIFLDEIHIKDENLKQLFCSILSHKDSRSKLVFDEDMQTIAFAREYSLKGILTSIEYYLNKADNALFSVVDLHNILKQILPLIIDYEKIINILENIGKLKKISIDNYYFPFVYKTKREMVEFIFSLHPNGIKLHQNIDFIKDELDKYFPNKFTKNDKGRAIQGLAGFSEDIFLWDWGKYIHINYINPILKTYDFSWVINYLDEYLQDTQIDLQACFEMFEDNLDDAGIENKYALHTCLKLKYPEKYSYQDSPWISKAGTARRELGQTLKNIMTENRNYSLEELIELMHTTKTRVQQLIDNTNDIIQVNAFEYKRKEFIAFSDDLLVQIIQYVNNRVQILDFIYIDLVLEKFSYELKEYSQYSIDIMLLELLKKDLNEKEFNVSNTRLVQKDYPLTRTSLNFHLLIENLLKGKKAISINELANYFLERGLAQDRILNYYHYSKIKKIVRIDKETFISIDSLGLTENDIEKINLLFENSLMGEVHLDDIIMNYKLPIISSKWNRFILTDLTDHNKVIFNPSRENPHYILPKSQ